MSATNAFTAVQGPARSALIVDDDPFMTDILKDMLVRLGVRRVQVAHDGAEGIRLLDQAASDPPPFVLCDLQMPGTDGFLFMEALAQRQFAGGVVLVSGTDDRTRHSAGLMARFHRLKFLGTLAKPVLPEALAQVLAAQP